MKKVSNKSLNDDESIESIMAKAKAFEKESQNEHMVDNLKDRENESLVYFLDCQGCGKNQGNFECKECQDRFCKDCVIREHLQSESFCLNCAY